MATVGTLFPATDANAAADAASSSGSNSSQKASDPLANESTFLQLLVTQLKNQDPSQPMDGTTFVTQLAQFSDLEQNLAMRQDLDAISEKYLAVPPASSDGANTTSGNATNSSNSSATS